MDDVTGDDALDQLLHEAGGSFRATHTWTARPLAHEAPVRRRRPWLVPLSAAAATAAVVTGAVLALPSSTAPTTATGPIADLTLDMTKVDELALDDAWLVVSGGDFTDSGPTDSRIEVRRRADLSQVVTTLRTSFSRGSPGCLALTGDWLLWTDDELVPSELDPGPPTRWALWQRNLSTGEQRRLLAGGPTGVGEDRPCPVAGDGWGAWNHEGRVVLRELATGQTLSYVDDAVPLAFTPSGLVESRQRGPFDTKGPDGVTALLRSGPSYQDRRLLRHVPLGTSLAAGGDVLVVITRDPKAQTQDGAVVSLCQLPSCSSLKELRREPGSSWAAVGDGLVAWSALADSPTIVRLDGRPAPPLAPGHSFFRTVKAWRGVLAYTTQEEVTTSPVVLHLLQVTS